MSGQEHPESSRDGSHFNVFTGKFSSLRATSDRRVNFGNRPHRCERRMQQHNASSQAMDIWKIRPKLQRMMKSLASDPALWDAVLNNEAVWEEFMESASADKEIPRTIDGSSDTDSTQTSTTNIVMRIFDGAKGVIKKIIEILNKPFHGHRTADAQGTGHPFNEKLRISFMLSITLLVVAIVGRKYRA